MPQDPIQYDNVSLSHHSHNSMYNPSSNSPPPSSDHENRTPTEYVPPAGAKQFGGRRVVAGSFRPRNVSGQSVESIQSVQSAIVYPPEGPGPFDGTYGSPTPAPPQTVSDGRSRQSSAAHFHPSGGHGNRNGSGPITVDQAMEMANKARAPLEPKYTNTQDQILHAHAPLRRHLAPSAAAAAAAPPPIPAGTKPRSTGGSISQHTHTTTNTHYAPSTSSRV